MQFIVGDAGDVANCSVRMDRAVATANAAGGRGGGLFLALYGFGGVTSSSIDLSATTASGNSAGGAGGGVVSLVSGSAPLRTGIEVVIASPEIRVHDVTLVGNSAGTR